MIKNSLKTNLKGCRGITLIALVVSVIVLLILAGVSISAITGNESAMEKAKQARTANEQGAELDAIKLAVVSAMANGDYTLKLNVTSLRNGLAGLIKENPEDVITANGTEWTVTGNTGVKYKITNTGSIEVKSGVILTPPTLAFTENGTVSGTITATLSADLDGNAITWSSNSSVVTVTGSGTTASVSLVTSKPAGMTQEQYTAAMTSLVTNGATIQAQAEGAPTPVSASVSYAETTVATIAITSGALNLKTEGTTSGTITVAGAGQYGTTPLDLTSSNIALIGYSSNDTSVATVSKQADGSATVTQAGVGNTTIDVKYDKNGNGTFEDGETVGSVSVYVKSASPWGEPELQTYYGNDVDYESANGTTDWQLFYRNETHTYLIKKTLGSYVLPLQGSYTNASFDDDEPTNMAKRLNPKLASEQASLFTAYTLGDNMKALAYMCDTNVWKGYTSGNTVANEANTNAYAVIAPSIELYVASFNADTTDVNKTRTLATPTTLTYGYKNSWTNSSGTISTTYNSGIYNKGGSTSYWLASPMEEIRSLTVDCQNSYIGNALVSTNSARARPLVCIPNGQFNLSSISGYTAQ